MSEIWRPSAARVADTNLTRFMDGLNTRKGLRLRDYGDSVYVVDRGAGGLLEGVGCALPACVPSGEPGQPSLTTAASRAPRCPARASFAMRA